MTRILVAKAVSRTARKENLTDETLKAAVRDAEAGIYRADLGDETFKVDIARKGRGKSHGYRGILGLRPGYRAYFVFLWPKNEFENIKDEYLAGLKALIRGVMDMNDETLESGLQVEAFREIVQEQPDGDEQAQENQDGGQQDEG